LFKNLSDNLLKLLDLSFKFIDLLKIFCRSTITRPIPNSTADNIKKKNVKDSILTLSYINPIIRERLYKVIHKNSAVSNKCSAVFILITIPIKIKKNKKNKKLTSPKNISYKLNITSTNNTLKSLPTPTEFPLKTKLNSVDLNPSLNECTNRASHKNLSNIYLAPLKNIIDAKNIYLPGFLTENLFNWLLITTLCTSDRGWLTITGLKLELIFIPLK
jgi:hypothetical protein